MISQPKSILALPALCVALCAGTADAQPLPEGNTGIASRYLEDEGIENDAAVLFADDFESVPGSQLDFGVWDNVYGRLAVSTAPGTFHAGAAGIEITHQTADNAQGAWRDFGPNGVPTMHFRYYMKYHAQFPGCHHTGGGILAAAPGVDLGSSTGQVPDGTNHYTALIDDIPPFFDWAPPGSVPPGFMYVYCYHMDQGSQWGDVFMPDGSISPNQRTFTNDPNFTARPNVILDRDRWYSFELMVQTNTIGQTDGRIAFWIDGEIAGDFPGLRLRTVDSLLPNVAIMATYTSELFPNQTLYYDDVVVATEYIGPMNGGAIQPPADMGGGGDPDMGGGGGSNNAANNANNTSNASTGGDPNNNGVVENNVAGPNNATGDAGTGGGPTETSGGEAGGCCATAPNRTPTSLLVLLAGVLLCRRRASRS